MNFKTAQKAVGIWEENYTADFDTMQERPGQKLALETVMELLHGDYRTVGLLGASRTGKSWICSAAVNHEILQPYKDGGMGLFPINGEMIGILRSHALYMTFFEFELKLRTAQHNGTLEALYSELVAPRLVVFDEIGRGKWSDFTATYFENTLIRRYGAKKQTLMASNLTSSEFRDMFDNALLERFREGRFVTLSGETTNKCIDKTK